MFTQRSLPRRNMPHYFWYRYTGTTAAPSHAALDSSSASSTATAVLLLLLQIASAAHSYFFFCLSLTMYVRASPQVTEEMKGDEEALRRVHHALMEVGCRHGMTHSSTQQNHCCLCLFVCFRMRGARRLIFLAFSLPTRYFLLAVIL